MDFNAFEEPSPFASFWPGGNHDLDNDMPSSLGSLATQSMQHADSHDQPHQSEVKIDATPTPSPQHALSTTAAIADVAGGQDHSPALAEAQPFTETEAAGVADQETREATPMGVTQSEVSPARETSAMETTQTPSVMDAQESRAQTEPQEGEPSTVRSERARSAPSPSPPITIEPAFSKSPEPVSLAEEVVESISDAEMVSAPDAQIYEEVLAHTPAKESPRQLEASPRQPEEPQEPQPESTPLDRRRQSASEVMTASAEKDVGSEEESQGRHASAPAMAVREPSEAAAEEPQMSASLPEPLDTKTPAKPEQTIESDAIQTSAIKNQEARSKSSSRERPQAATDVSAESPEDGSRLTVITPATARRGQLTKPVEKSTEKETPRRRGRPPKDAATPASAKPATPASRSKRMSVRGQAPSTDKGPTRRVGTSAQRKVSTPRTLARVVKRAPAPTAKVSTTASGAKKRGRPPKDAGSRGALVTPAASKVEGKAVPGRRTRTSLGAAQTEPAASKTKTKARTASQPARTIARTGAIKIDQTPRRRGRPPKATSAEQSKGPPKSASVQRRGRQPKSATSETSKPSAAAVPTSAPKRRGRPPRSAAAVKSKAEPVVSGGTRSTAGPRPRQAEKQEAAPEPITRKRGRVEEPEKENDSSRTQKRGRPRRAAAEEEEPASKRRRLRGPVDGANEVKEREREKEKQAEAGKSRRGRPAKATTTTTTKAEKAAAPAASERAQRQGLRAAVVAPPSSRAGRPGRTPKDVADAKTETKTKTKTSPVAKTRGRSGRPATVQGAMAKAARPRGVVKTSLPLRSSRRGAGK